MEPWRNKIWLAPGGGGQPTGAPKYRTATHNFISLTINLKRKVLGWHNDSHDIVEMNWRALILRNAIVIFLLSLEYICAALLFFCYLKNKNKSKAENWAYVTNIYNSESMPLGDVHILCQPKMGGGPDPPSSPCQPKIRNWLTPLPPLSEKIRNWLTPPPPLVRNHILTHYN